MTSDELIIKIDYWVNWASSNSQFDIALMKIWIQFEKYLSLLFILYSTGQQSSKQYAPTLKLEFIDEEQFNVFMRDGNKKYIEYLTKIESVSKYIFISNPFEIIISDVNYKSVYNSVKCIRNYIAHESGESKTKLTNILFSGNPDNFKEPNNFLVSHNRVTRESYFTYYTRTLKEIAIYVENPSY